MIFFLIKSIYVIYVVVKLITIMSKPLKLSFKRIHTRHVHLLEDDALEEKAEFPDSTVAAQAQQSVSHKKSFLQQLFGCIKGLFLFKKRVHVDALNAAKDTCNTAIELINTKIDTLKKKEDAAEVIMLQHMRSRNMPKAVHALKRKKYYTRQLDKLNIHKFNVESQLVALEESVTNKDVFSTMKTVNSALKRAGKKIKVQDIENTMEDMTEMMQDTTECSDALQERIGSVSDIPDEELELELESIMLQLDDDGKPKTPPPIIPAFPDVPTDTPKNIIRPPPTVQDTHPTNNPPETKNEIPAAN